MSKKMTSTATPLNADKRSRFAELTDEAKMLEKEINELLSSFEKRNNLVCHPIPSKRNSIELVISTDIDQL